MTTSDKFAAREKVSDEEAPEQANSSGSSTLGPSLTPSGASDPAPRGDAPDQTSLSDDKDPYKVDWDGPADPDNPKV